MEPISRRNVLKWTAAAGVAGMAPWAFGADPTPAIKPIKKALFFTKSAGFQHSVIDRKGKPLAYAEQILVDLVKPFGIDVTATKDGSVFTPDGLAPYDAVVFMTTGDLTTEGTDKQPPMPKGGKQNLIDFVAGGKGLVGLHCASDTFHGKGTEIDPYIQLLGGEFVTHGEQQNSTAHVVNSKFPGTPAEDFTFKEEWYALTHFAPDLDVILTQKTAGMKGPMYQRADYPATWCRSHGSGRVFYSSMGHREDVWQNAIFTTLLTGAMRWATGLAEYKPVKNWEGQ